MFMLDAFKGCLTLQVRSVIHAMKSDLGGHTWRDDLSATGFRCSE